MSRVFGRRGGRFLPNEPEVGNDDRSRIARAIAATEPTAEFGRRSLRDFSEAENRRIASIGSRPGSALSRQNPDRFGSAASRQAPALFGPNSIQANERRGLRRQFAAEQAQQAGVLQERAQRAQAREEALSLRRRRGAQQAFGLSQLFGLNDQDLEAFDFDEDLL